MLAFFVKITIAVFLAFVAFDAFYKIGKIDREVKDEGLNPNMAAILRRRTKRAGILYLIVALAAFASLFFKVKPLGE